MSSDTERVREIENTVRMIGDVGKPEKKVPTAGCPTCKTPLIGTMAFSGAEFYCLECGRTCGWLSPYALDADKVEEQMKALQAEWDENVGGKLMPRGTFWRNDCEKCGDVLGRPEGGHWEHVTQEEIEADKEAREWLKQRVRR